MGPMELSYPLRCQYFATFLDDHSTYNFVGFMRYKSGLFDTFSEFSSGLGEMGAISGAKISVPRELANNFETVTIRINPLHSDQIK